MNFDISYEGRTTLGADYASAIELGYPASLAGAALKNAARELAEETADGYRARLARTSAGKLAEYRIKEDIARDPASADAAELALLDREAAARGMDRDTLIAAILARASAYRQISLLIAAMEAEVKAAIDAVPDDAPDIEAQIDSILQDAKAAADQAFADAQAMLAGAG